MNFERIKLVKPLSIAVGQRIIPPTEKNVAAMMASFVKYTQLTPIAVMPVTTNTYRLIVGATRLEAAIKLGWNEIRVEVVTGTEDEFEAHEILENLDRRDLTRQQRAMLRQRKRDLEHRMLENVQKTIGGRGQKGGVREAARQAGVPLATAQRRHNKPTQNEQSGSVSDAPSAKKRPKTPQMSIRMGQSERTFVEELCGVKKFMSLSDTVRAIVRGDAPNQRDWMAEKNMHLGSDGVRH